MSCNCNCNSNNIDAKQLIKNIESLFLTSDDIVDFGLVTMKAIGKTKKEWVCNYSGNKIAVGSQAIRSFRPDSYGGFEKLYWDVNILYDVYKNALIDISEINIHEDAFDSCYEGWDGHKN